MDLRNQERQLESLMRECLERRFSLYRKGDTVIVAKFSTVFSIAYRLVSQRLHNNLDANIDEDTCYELWNYLPENVRGRGFGLELYNALEDFARILGCKRVIVTPSGITAKGESKYIAYQRRGFKPINEVELEKILE